jgi:hypothetical protein
MSQATERYRELAKSPKESLERIMRDGRRPAIDSLLGYEYRGWNHPRFTALAGGQKFIKGFFAADGGAYGFNVRARQTGLDGDWTARGSDDHPKRFAFYSVAPVRPGPDAAYPAALLLDYGQGNNPVLDPARTLRDYLVRVEPESDDLLLGKAYIAVTARRFALAFFVLERWRSFDAADAALARRVLG